MAKTYYRDFYGSTASVTETRTHQFRVRVRAPYGKLVLNKVYNSLRGARIAMSHYGDTWYVTANEQQS